MSHAGEYGAFKNNSSKPYAKIAQGIDFLSPTTSPVENTNNHVTPPSENTSLEMGRVGISALRGDAEHSTLVNPYETENRANIVARLQEIAAPYIQAARLEVPNAEENKKGLFGGLKDYQGTTPESSVMTIFGSRRVKKKTSFVYEVGKDYNRLRYGHTEMEDYRIHTRIYFNESEQIDSVICNLPKQSSTDDAPEGLELIAKLRDDLGWKFPGFEIQFFLSGDQLGAKLSPHSINLHHSESDELVYDKMTNSFAFRTNASIGNLSPDQFIELVEAALQFTPIGKY